MKRSTAYVQKFKADKIRYKVELEQREKKAQKSSSLRRSTGSSKTKIKVGDIFLWPTSSFNRKYNYVRKKSGEQISDLGPW